MRKSLRPCGSALSDHSNLLRNQRVLAIRERAHRRVSRVFTPEQKRHAVTSLSCTDTSSKFGPVAPPRLERRRGAPRIPKDDLRRCLVEKSMTSPASRSRERHVQALVLHCRGTTDDRRISSDVEFSCEERGRHRCIPSPSFKTHALSSESGPHFLFNEHTRIVGLIACVHVAPVPPTEESLDFRGRSIGPAKRPRLSAKYFPRRSSPIHYGVVM